MAPDLSRQEQKAQTRDRQGRMFELSHLGGFVSLEQSGYSSTNSVKSCSAGTSPSMMK
jgi:hypothetical protein